MSKKQCINDEVVDIDIEWIIKELYGISDDMHFFCTKYKNSKNVTGSVLQISDVANFISVIRVIIVDTIIKIKEQQKVRTNMLTELIYVLRTLDIYLKGTLVSKINFSCEIENKLKRINDSIKPLVEKILVEKTLVECMQK